MKILTFRRLFWLSAIGGFAYVHKQRGGDWTMASMSETLRHLWGSVASAVREPLRRATGPGSTMDNGLSEERTYGRYAQREDDTGRH